MFRPNNTCRLRRFESYDAYGQPKFAGLRLVPCGVVKLELGTERTSVRTDSSATRGNAEETVSQAKILFPTWLKLAKEDKIEIAGFELRIVSLHPRFDVTGRHDHDECSLTLWVEDAG